MNGLQENPEGLCNSCALIINNVRAAKHHVCPDVPGNGQPRIRCRIQLISCLEERKQQYQSKNEVGGDCGNPSAGPQRLQDKGQIFISYSPPSDTQILTTVNHWHLSSPQTSGSLHIPFPMPGMFYQCLFILHDKTVFPYSEAQMGSLRELGSSLPTNFTLFLAP